MASDLVFSVFCDGLISVFQYLPCKLRYRLRRWCCNDCSQRLTSSPGLAVSAGHRIGFVASHWQTGFITLWTDRMVVVLTPMQWHPLCKKLRWLSESNELCGIVWVGVLTLQFSMVFYGYLMVFCCHLRSQKKRFLRVADGDVLILPQAPISIRLATFIIIIICIIIIIIIILCYFIFFSKSCPRHICDICVDDMDS